ncbi:MULTISPECIES: TM2 domain-containing protein [unclassified Synechocystis]|uniref:TM2 domain-containing protein n=1 Tax=unclassified Synechocystis TaxID=2640012 RepID=UPI00040DEC06|nr:MULTISPECIES: TM2 domain-containing protein [unclassified Synechocystis]AIE74368.1 TM2 domain containing protein [Synechocystis sp. PCC 6714]MCT0254857.1 TM2 domain-containing protein [Synechocystis sp. CS-94]
MKNRFVALIFAVFFGGFGLHKFYLGNIFAGIVYFLFSWTFIPSILGFVDAIILGTMDERKFNAIYNHKHYFPPAYTSPIVTAPPSVTPIERLDVLIIKTCATKAIGATVSECIVATGEDPQKVKETIDSLCRKGFLLPDNREGDYAVVYRPI